MNHSALIKFEKEISRLLVYRLNVLDYSTVKVKAHHALDKTIVCRIELYGKEKTIVHRLATYEATVKEGFYFEAEQNLISQLKLRVIV